MKANANIGLSIHNRFNIEVKDAETQEVIQRGKAENIVLDRMYTRLLDFNSYFTNIVFGSGTGTPTPDRTTLFQRISHKSATTDEVVKDYPVSQVTKKITLGVTEHNGNVIREVGISETTTNINTHALITDSEGNPLEIEKTDRKIIDIYATVFVEVYSVDTGCFFNGDGLRDYLLGGSSPSNSVAIGGIGEGEVRINGTRSKDLNNKSVSITGQFGVGDFNKDVKFIEWEGVGLRWNLPRPGVYEGTSRTNVEIGIGDGVENTFKIPNEEVTDLTVKIEGNPTTDYIRGGLMNDEVVFNSPPGESIVITADYTTKYIPKDKDHILPFTMTISFGVSEPAPVIPPPDFSSLELPGGNTLIGGDTINGYLGEVSSAELISGDDLANEIGLTAGTSQESDAGWLKYYNNGNVDYVAKRTIRYSISWNDINNVGAVFGDKKIVIGNNVFAVRLLSSKEWDKLIYPVHEQFGEWAQFTDADIRVASGNGRATWTSTPSGSSRLCRGYSSVTSSDNNTPSHSGSNYGFRPVLTFLRTL